MTNAAFVFNGVPSFFYPWLLVNQIQRAATAPRDVKTIDVPGRAGAYFARVTRGVRVEKIKINVLADSQEELAERARILADWLDTDTPGTFYYPFEQDKVYKAILDGDTDLDKVVTDGETELTFLILDPFAEGALNTAKVEGVSARYEAKTVANWDAGTHGGTKAEDDPTRGPVLRLNKEGTDFLGTVNTSWEGGTHNGTAEVNNDYLALATTKAGTDFNKVFDTQADWDATGTAKSGTQSNTNGQIVQTLPVYNYMWNMADVESEGWEIAGTYGWSDVSQYTVVQFTGYVKLRNRTGSQYVALRQYGCISYPCTVDVFGFTSGDTTKNPYPFIYVSNGSKGGYVKLPITQSTDKVWFRVTVDSTGNTAKLYRDGTYVGSYSLSGPVYTNRLTLGVDSTGTVCDFQIEACYVISSDQGAPPANNEYSGTWTSQVLDISPLVTAGNSAKISYNAQFTSMVENEKQQTLIIESRISSDGGSTWGSWTQIVSTQSATSGTYDIPGITSGTSMTNKRLQIRITLKTQDRGNSIIVDSLSINIISKNQYPSSGERISPVIDISQVKKASRTTFTYVVYDQPAGTTVTLYTQYSLDGGTTWSGWALTTNGGAIPGITPTTDLSNARFQYKFVLTTSNPELTPLVDRADYSFYTGYKASATWTMPAFNVSAAGKVGASEITWTYDPNGTGNLTVEARISTNGGSSWTNWATVTYDQEVPGLRGTTGALVQVRLTLTTTDTTKTPYVTYLNVTAKEDVPNVITYKGTAPGYPVFTCTINAGGVDHLKITHAESGKYILIQTAFNAGDVVTIDTKKNLVQLNGVNRMQYLNMKSRFFTLQKGTNTIICEPDGGAVITMDWTERWK